jgi:hypothetical protein
MLMEQLALCELNRDLQAVQEDWLASKRVDWLWRLELSRTMKKEWHRLAEVVL